MEKLIPFKNPKMIPFEGEIEDWLKAISHKKIGYLKKKRDWHFLIFYWEKSDDYYLNFSIYKGKNTCTPSVWVTRRDSLSFIQSYINKEYALYIDE